MSKAIVRFYLLQKSDQRLPLLVKLLQRALQEQLKTVICCENEALQNQIDEYLWAEADFLPHATQNDDIKNAPILLICEPELAPPCQLLVQLGTKVDIPRGCERIFEIVCDNDLPQTKMRARERFRLYQERGMEPQVHKI